MDSVTLPPIHEPVKPAAVSQASRDNESFLEHRKIEAAKGFESLLIGKLVESMKETVDESGLLEDEGSEQVQSMFWMHLSTVLSEQGGTGLWKDIYKSLYGTAPKEHIRMEESSAQFDKTI